MAQLSRLAGSLTQLLIQGGNMHTVFSTLTGLQHLEIWHCPLSGMGGVTLERVLRKLSGLTCLVRPAAEHAVPCASLEPCEQ